MTGKWRTASQLLSEMLATDGLERAESSLAAPGHVVGPARSGLRRFPAPWFVPPTRLVSRDSAALLRVRQFLPCDGLLP